MDRRIMLIFLGFLFFGCARDKRAHEGGGAKEEALELGQDAVARTLTPTPRAPLPSPQATEAAVATTASPLGELRGSCRYPNEMGRCVNHHSHYPGNFEASCSQDHGVYSVGVRCEEAGVVARCIEGFPGLETLYFATKKAYEKLDTMRIECKKIGGQFQLP